MEKNSLGHVLTEISIKCILRLRSGLSTNKAEDGILNTWKMVTLVLILEMLRSHKCNKRLSDDIHSRLPLMQMCDNHKSKKIMRPEGMIKVGERGSHKS